MSTQPPQSQQPRPRPSTPTSSAQPSKDATPRSNPPASSQASPAKLHSRVPSGSQTQGPRGPSSQPMQRNNSSNKGNGLPKNGMGTPNARPMNGTTARNLGPAGKKPAGKSVPGMSSAGKGLGLEAGSSRPATPGSSSLNIGLPAVPSASPALSAQGGGSQLDALGSFGSPALSGLGNMVAGVDMGLTLSNISGLERPTASSGGAKIDDEERRKRLEVVLGTLRKRPGTISREAIERLGRKYGLDMLPSENSLTLAGTHGILVDLHYKHLNSAAIDKVETSFMNSSDEVKAYEEDISRILHQDLTPAPDTATINAKLDKFADNLDRLASMDRLSKAGANCFEAVNGVYQSLRKLYQHERKMAQELASSNDDKWHLLPPSMEALCLKSGRPRMHARGRVGMSLDYWTDRRHVTKPQTGEQLMDDEEGSREGSLEDCNLYSLTIECECSVPALYTPMRVTNDWIADRVVIPQEELRERETRGQWLHTIDWQDPPPSFQEEETQEAAEPSSNKPQLPHARFVAHLEPPLILRWGTADMIHDELGMTLQQEGVVSSPYDHLVMPLTQSSIAATTHSTNPHQQSQHPRSISLSRRIASSSSTDDEGQTYELRLLFPRAEGAVRLEKLPFSHPRQLIESLPFLRQYAALSHIMCQSFGCPSPRVMRLEPAAKGVANQSTGSKRTADEAFASEAVSTQATSKRAPSTNSSIEDWLDGQDDQDAESLTAFLDAPASTTVPNTIDVSFNLALQHLDVAFPTRGGLVTCKIKVDIQGIVSVEELRLNNEFEDARDENGRPLKSYWEADERAEVLKRVASEKGREITHAFEVCEDLGVWVSWLKRNVLREHEQDGMHYLSKSVHD